MPEVFRLFGFSFFFYANDHEPIHIHVEGKGGIAKFVWNDGNFTLMEGIGIKASDLRKISEAINDNKEVIVDYWIKFFNSDKE